jgi:hypothetical protein
VNVTSTQPRGEIRQRLPRGAVRARRLLQAEVHAPTAGMLLHLLPCQCHHRLGVWKKKRGSSGRSISTPCGSTACGQTCCRRA